MTDWLPLYHAWLAAHPDARRVSWQCQHATRTPINNTYRHVPNAQQRRYQTMRPRLWGISEGWRGQTR